MLNIICKYLRIGASLDSGTQAVNVVVGPHTYPGAGHEHVHDQPEYPTPAIVLPGSSLDQIGGASLDRPGDAPTDRPGDAPTNRPEAAPPGRPGAVHEYNLCSTYSSWYKPRQATNIKGKYLNIKPVQKSMLCAKI